MEEHNDIWAFIEKKMKLDIPPYMKDVLIACGYDNCYNIGTIEESDINYFTDAVQKGKLKNILDKENEFENFEFNRGHKKLLLAIANFVQKTLESDGIDGFSLKAPKRKLHSIQSMTYAPRKKMRNTNLVDVGNLDEDPIRAHRSTLLRLIVKQLITETADLFSEMLTVEPSHDVIRIEIDLPNDITSVHCSYCGKANYVYYSHKDSPNSVPWWNISNFRRHLMNIHNSEPKNKAMIMVKSVDSRSIETKVDENIAIPSIDGTRKYVANWGSFGIVLQNFVTSLERNVERKKSGYRFDQLTKAFSTYIFMLSGRLAYETLNANLPFSLPSISTVHRYMADKGPKIVEGEMRTKELLSFKKKRNSPLVVSLSEDATRITAKISYDPNTNQLIGFAPPLDKHGMPITLSFPARNIGEIRGHFSNPLNNVSSSLYVQMAQPLDRNIPPFCLMMFLTDNTFEADKVHKRWKFQADELKQEGIKIHNIASDGHSRPLKAMKQLSRIGQPDDNYFDCEWFSCGTLVETTFTQDLFHILTKLRNLLLKCSRIIPIGNKIVSSTHLKYLVENVSKDKHRLTRYDIDPKDRQNVTSAEKICAENVMECLSKHVPGSEATIMFLRAMRYVCEAFSENNLASSERIYYMWYSVFFIRAWRSWILQSEKVENRSAKSSSKSSAKKWKHVYTLKENFISYNCYSCIELNAHALIKQILVEDSEEGTPKIFFPDLYASQPCEKTFRQVRSFTSTYSTVVNFNMLDIMHRIKKVQLQSDIMAEWNHTIKFPRFEKKMSANDSSLNKLEGLSRKSIKIEIERAKNTVTRDLTDFGIDTSTLDFHCQVKPVLDIDEGDSDDEIDSDVEEVDSCYDYFENEVTELSFEESELRTLELTEEDPDEDYIPGITGDLMMRDYNINVDSEEEIRLDETSPYVAVRCSNGVIMVVRKSSICWLLSKDKCKMSSDRLVRVQEKDYLKANITSTAVGVLGTWYSWNKEGHLSAESVGKHQYVNINRYRRTVLGFTYMDGDTFKKREFSKTSALIPSTELAKTNDRSVGVLCTFYTYDSNGTLSSAFLNSHSFMNIENYGGTINNPVYSEGKLSISKDLVFKTEDLLLHND